MAIARMLTIRERRDLRAALLSDLTRVEEQCASLTRDLEDMAIGSEHSNADDEHDPEGMTTGFERAQLNALLVQSEREQCALRVALDRVAEPGFGLCEHCGEFIGVERLLALPATTRCINCAH